jgi:hypothetical protein
VERHRVGLYSRVCAYSLGTTAALGKVLWLVGDQSSLFEGIDEVDRLPILHRPDVYMLTASTAQEYSHGFCRNGPRSTIISC